MGGWRHSRLWLCLGKMCASVRLLSTASLWVRVATISQIPVPEREEGEVVDVMQNWFETGACDGFNILPPFYLGGLEDFVNMVTPELQRRGLFRTAYEGTTFRDILGIPTPVSRYAAKD